ncbi:MAG: hypothetical protein DWQ02_17370 [Bacteroidetes bacterium]|nr:MAG: hypothetical protein DWQ02_17370 [Bacteroidota bacterium]
MKKWHVLLAIGLLVIFLVVKISWRNSLLKRTGVEGIAQVEKIVVADEIRRNQTTTAFFMFFANGKKYSGSTHILNDKIKEGDCYEVLYSETNPKIVEINFSKKVECEW